MQQFSGLLSWRSFTTQHVSGVSPPIIRSSMIAVAASGFTFVSWWQSYCVRGRADRPARPRAQHDYHHDTKVKPEYATAVIKLLMMGGGTPETCSVVNERQFNKLENCCIWLVIYMNSIIIFYENVSRGRLVVPCGQTDGWSDMTTVVDGYRKLVCNNASFFVSHVIALIG
jgi:hypothetical protein